MYETEVNSRAEAQDVVPEAVLQRLRQYRARVIARTVLPWGEHCTECVWPSCYSSCELYDPRPDGGCRQFEGGVARVPTPGAVIPYLQKITFRRWAKLWTPATLALQPLSTADRWEALNGRVGGIVSSVPAPVAIKRRLLAKVGYLRRQKLVGVTSQAGVEPDFFVLEVYNPGTSPVGLTLSIWSSANRGSAPRFQRLIMVPPGFTRERIPFVEISQASATEGEFQVEIVPNDAERITLYFGLIEFVKEITSTTGGQGSKGPAEMLKCKCVVWDLDNTVWSGTLVEDGLDGISLKPDIMKIISELDRRGILQSIASKNNRDDVLIALKRFGISEYFLCPQIHWSPKSQSVAAIAKSLNIDPATFVFVDDQAFERAEVAATWPQVRVVDGSELHDFLESPILDVPLTEEASRRREMYRQQEIRDALEASYHGDYLGFLRDNKMTVRLSTLVDENIERVYELAQRTNQMNFSGNRYLVADLRRIKEDGGLETHVIRCEDRFGKYGIVGFAVVDRSAPRLVDLMFSCRVQAKRVEHGFLAWLLNQYRVDYSRDFLADFKKTPKNAASGAVFAEMGFEEIGVQDGVTRLRFPHDKPVPIESVVDVGFEETPK